MTIGALGWAATAAALAIALLFVWRVRKERRRTNALLSRLDDLETRLERALVMQQPAEESGSAAPVPQAVGAGVAAPSGDVLAGLTSRVQRIVANPGTEACTLADQAIACAHRHIEERLTPSDMAAELHVSLRTLERGLALALDCTPRELILAVKMREARRMLLSGRYRVKEVAFRLGFADQYHFSRCFKSFYHCPPSEAGRVH